jgi:cytochrome oxidase Cu insertion factor (SCO1/SenC/PrrC family)
MTRLTALALMFLCSLIEARAGETASEPAEPSATEPSGADSSYDCPYCAAASVNSIAAKAGLPIFTDWLDAKARHQVDLRRIAFTDQDGTQGQLDSLIDRPTLVTFFYTRCQNNSKCTAVISQLASLQRQLKKEHQDNSYRIICITYEPQYDDPQHLKSYGADRGIEFNEAVRLLQLSLADQEIAIKRLHPPVSYNSEWVTSHGVELTLLDPKSRMVRKYHTVIWNNDQVIQDLNKVLAESP